MVQHNPLIPLLGPQRRHLDLHVGPTLWLYDPRAIRFLCVGRFERKLAGRVGQSMCESILLGRTARGDRRLERRRRFQPEPTQLVA
eukprot:3940604-Rhodomonas_salina.2